MSGSALENSPPYLCRYTDISGNNRIRADPRVIADRDRPEDSGACSDIHMPANADIPSDRHLLKQKTVHPDLGLGMHDNPVGVGQQEAPPIRLLSGMSAPVTTDQNLC